MQLHAALMRCLEGSGCSADVGKSILNLLICLLPCLPLKAPQQRAWAAACAVATLQLCLQHCHRGACMTVVVFTLLTPVQTTTKLALAGMLKILGRSVASSCHILTCRDADILRAGCAFSIDRHHDCNVWHIMRLPEGAQEGCLQGTRQRTHRRPRLQACTSPSS